jgi:hypothetical protein
MTRRLRQDVNLRESELLCTAIGTKILVAERESSKIPINIDDL